LFPSLTGNKKAVRLERRIPENLDFGYFRAFTGVGGPREGSISTVAMANFPQHGQIFGSKGLGLRRSIKQKQRNILCTKYLAQSLYREKK
jgi:hypothetical protein